MKTKICSKCGEEKELTEFHKDKRHNDGLRYNCKVCVLKSKVNYDATHQLEIKNYYIENREQILKQTKKYKEEHKKERHEYYLKNKEKLREQNRISRKRRLKTNIQYKLSVNLRSYIYVSLKRNTKVGRAIKLIGCSWEFLKKHLEAQFKEGMTWDNWSRTGWHIDHIKPIDSFDLTKPEEQMRCFHFTNLQPLWAKENLSKYNKIGD